jgi:hypothetical protein
MSSARAQLAQWIEQEHPQLFAALYAQAARAGFNSRPVRLRGCGCDHAHLGALGQDDAADFLDAESAVANSAVDYSGSVAQAGETISASDPMSEVSFDASTIGSGVGASLSSGSGDFLSSVGSGLANAAEGVGSWLTSSQGLTSLTNLASTLVATNAQQQVLAAQVARAQAGQAPLPITYAVAANGQAVPVYQVAPGTPIMAPSYVPPATLIPAPLQAAVASGTARPVLLPDGSAGYTVPPSTLSSLFSGSDSWLWLVLGAAVLLAATR